MRSISKVPEAVAGLLALVDFSPTDAEAWAELADVYLEQGLYAQAIYALEEVLVLVPNAWNVRFLLLDHLFCFLFSFFFFVFSLLVFFVSSPLIASSKCSLFVLCFGAHLTSCCSFSRCMLAWARSNTWLQRHLQAATRRPRKSTPPNHSSGSVEASSSATTTCVATTA